MKVISSYKLNAKLNMAVGCVELFNEDKDHVINANFEKLLNISK